jgi:hypothetical protein
VLIRGRPYGVILVSLLLIVAFCSDFFFGATMFIGTRPIPPVYADLGNSYGLLLIFGGFVGLLLLYGILKLKNWARLILLVLFPAQVIFNIALDPLILENYTLLVMSLILSVYLLLPSTREHFS